MRRIAERTVLDVPGVVPAGGDAVLTRTLPSATCRLEQTGARVEVDVATQWPLSLPAVASMVRDRVAHRVHELTGLGVASVDVAVSRITPPSDVRRVQ